MVLAENIQLVPDGTLLIHLIMIGVMVAVLNRTLLKPINKILSDREKQASGKLSEAETIKAESQQKLAEYQAALTSARTEGYKLLEKERADALKEKESKVRSTKDEVARRVADEIGSLKNQEAQVRKELEAQASSISELISAQVLRR